MFVLAACFGDNDSSYLAAAQQQPISVPFLLCVLYLLSAILAKPTLQQDPNQKKKKNKQDGVKELPNVG